jgi:hypothetical protein
VLGLGHQPVGLGHGVSRGSLGAPVGRPQRQYGEGHDR